MVTDWESSTTDLPARVTARIRTRNDVPEGTVMALASKTVLKLCTTTPAAFGEEEAHVPAEQVSQLGASPPSEASHVPHGSQVDMARAAPPPPAAGIHPGLQKGGKPDTGGSTR